VTSLDLVDSPPRAGTLAIGDRGPAFEDLLGTDGARHGFSSVADSRLLVLIFSSNRCPTAKAYADRMNALQGDLGPLGVQLIAINSNDPHLYPDESYPRMVERAADDRYAFPYLVDDGQRLAKAYGATCTFHVFLLDHERRLRYEGRFDDSRLPAKVTTHDLRNAIEDVLAGRAVRVSTTRPFGCSLDLV
jgi:peroxiredoxin